MYLHGQPGAGDELSIVPAFTERFGSRLIVPERSKHPELPFGLHMDVMAGELRDRLAAAHVHLVGFSIGAFVAVELAARLGKIVSRMDLISAAAPLQSGDFLKQMAGRQVFEFAASSPLTFRRLTALQSAVCRFAPGLIHRLLFASAQSGDRTLIDDDTNFKRQSTQWIKSGLTAGRAGYLRDVTSYVLDWRAQSAEVNPAARTRLWHGADDNWSPPNMMDAVAQLLPGTVEKRLLPDQSHYSTLQAALTTMASEVIAHAE